MADYDYEAALARQMRYTNELTRRIIRIEAERDALRRSVVELQEQAQRERVPLVCICLFCGYVNRRCNAIYRW